MRCFKLLFDWFEFVMLKFLSFCVSVLFLLEDERIVILNLFVVSWCVVVVFILLLLVVMIVIFFIVIFVVFERELIVEVVYMEVLWIGIIF